MRSLPPRLAAFGVLLTTILGIHAADAPPVPFVGKLCIVRYDMPLGFSDGLAPTRQPAKRKETEDGVEWPDFTLNGQPVFRGKSEEQLPLKFHQGGEALSPFQLPTDDVLQPGNHWFRAMEWRRGLRHIYTADWTARCSNTAGVMSGRYELWLFPIRIQGDGGPFIKNVEVKVGGAVIYHQAGPWRSLTLLLPQNQPDKPYVLTVDGRPPITFHAGLQPVKPGTPREVVFPVNAAIAGDGPKISVRNLARPEEFPNPKEWAADVAALAQPLPAPTLVGRGKNLQRYLGAEVPISPLTIYAAALPHAMSGGFFKKGTDPEAYAQLLAKLGYNTVFDPANALPAPGDPESFEKRAAALAQNGVRLGLQYDNNWTRPALQHPNVAFFAHTLPDWHAPLYRSLSLAAQRFARVPNFAGLSIGADDAGYVSYWWWAPPIPDRPWGEGMIAFTGSAQPKMPRAPSLGPPELPFEQPVKTQDEFAKYVERYDVSFRQYGYFAEAVRDVNPRLAFTTGSFGSAPGTGGRGGWPWASIPGRVIVEGLPVQQAFDWNETHAAKPMQNVALVDRLRSYFPKKPTWTILDNHHFLYGREAFQRACALVLTRGAQGIGTNFLAHPDGENPRPDVVDAQAEMNAWMRRFGGVYARTEPLPVIGIFYGQLQAVQRRVLTGENASAEELLRGSHEGKVAEALFFCHAAGWPARVITHQEVLRGPLPSSMKAILLVGLDEADATWRWGTGLEAHLQKFLDRGGRILADDESICSVPFTKTGMKVAAYVPQSNFDPTPLLMARNAENIRQLRAAMDDVPAPIAASASETVWAIPTQCADTQYVTVVNQAFAVGDEAKERLLPADPKATKPEPWKFKGNASLYVKPQTGALKWNTQRPIYDVRLGRKITAEEAAQVDLTTDGFRWYALPPREITTPEITVEKGVSGFYEARVALHDAEHMAGIPVQITIAGPNDAVTIYTTTESVTRLPLSAVDDGDFTITATELLSGQSASASVQNQAPATVSPRPRVRLRDQSNIAKFIARKKVPLTIALTPEQEKDATLTAHAKTLRTFFESQGRTVALGSVKPGGIVESLQPLKSPHRYPQWKTVATDLVLFGTPSNNVLLRDQARGEIFPRDFSLPLEGEAALFYTRSPFVGECDALNIMANDPAGFAAAIQRLTTTPPSAAVPKPATPPGTIAPKQATSAQAVAFGRTQSASLGIATTARNSDVTEKRRDREIAFGFIARCRTHKHALIDQQARIFTAPFPNFQISAPARRHSARFRHRNLCKGGSPTTVPGGGKYSDRRPNSSRRSADQICRPPSHPPNHARPTG